MNAAGTARDDRPAPAAADGQALPQPLPSPLAGPLAGPLARPLPGPLPGPLIVTAEMPDDVLVWVDGLRRAHFPPERNRLRAHVTLFHALPPSCHDELAQLLAGLAADPPPPAQVTGLMKLGGGTALAIASPAMAALHGRIAERMHGLLTRQDAQPIRLHATIQNKVSAQAARALQAQLAPHLRPRDFAFRALGLYGYEGGPWRPLRDFAFRGSARRGDG